MAWTHRIILLCFFFSGASALIYEVVWLRMLVLVFGSTTLAVSTVLTAFMAGLALGSWGCGRVADQWRHPLRSYAVFEGCIGLYGLMVPWLFPLMVPIYQLAWDQTTASPLLFDLLRFILAMVVLLIPTTLMGATLPVLASFCRTGRWTADRQVGLLYAFNTGGAVLGTFGTGFVLLPTLGMHHTTLIAAALNILLSLTALWIAARESGQVGILGGTTSGDDPGSTVETAKVSTIPSPSDRRSDAFPSRSVVGLVLVAVAVSGYTALVYEVAWTRILSLVLGSSVYAFSAMLTTFLVGLALGSAILARTLDRMSRPITTLAWVQIAIALASYATSVLLERLPYAFLQALAWGIPLFKDHPDWITMGLWFAAAAVTMLVPTLLFGATFPLVVKIYHRQEHRLGRTAGDVYAINTLGAILGSFLAGFVLIPWLGLHSTLLFAILTNLVVGSTLILAAPSLRPARRMAVAVGSLGLAAVLLWVQIPWDPLMMSFNLGIESQRFLKAITHPSMQEWAGFKKEMTQAFRVDFYEEGRTATVAVLSDESGRRLLKNDGRPEGGEAYLPTHVLLAHVPLLLDQQPEDVLMIGLGTGVTLGSVQRYPVKRLEMVELEPAVIRAAEYFRPISGHTLDDPRLTLVVNDGRNQLLVSRDAYDAIISQPSVPWLTGVANLFTEDFFRLGAQKLRDGGMFCQWISVDGMTDRSFRSVLKAFHAVFPYVMVFDPASPDMILLGSQTPITISLDRLEAAFRDRAISSDLRRIGISNPYDVLATFAAGSDAMTNLLADAVINTDDNARVEISGPRDYYSGRIIGQPEVIRDNLFKAHRGVTSYLSRNDGDPVNLSGAELLALGRAYFGRKKLVYAYLYTARSLQAEESAAGRLLMAKLLAAQAKELDRTAASRATAQRLRRAALKAADAALSLDAHLNEAERLRADLHRALGEIE